MKALYELMFCAICFCFSAALLVLSLLGSVRLAALGDELTALESECAALEADNQIRRVEYEGLLSLEELERCAIEKLGLQHCSPSQIVVLDAAGIEN